MEQLNRTELAVLKAIFERNLSGYAPIYVPGLERRAIRDAVASLHGFGLIDATRAGAGADAGEDWIPGNVTEAGRQWLEVYGLKRR